MGLPTGSILSYLLPEDLVLGRFVRQTDFKSWVLINVRQCEIFDGTFKQGWNRSSVRSRECSRPRFDFGRLHGLVDLAGSLSEVDEPWLASHHPFCGRRERDDSTAANGVLQYQLQTLLLFLLFLVSCFTLCFCATGVCGAQVSG